MTIPILYSDTPAVQLPYVEERQIDETYRTDGFSSTTFTVVSTGEEVSPKWWEEKSVTAWRSPDLREREAPTPLKGQTPGDLRLRLLARKYGRQHFSTEDQARLDILSARIQEAVARVEEEDVKMLEDAASEIESSRDLRRRLEKEYGK